MGQDWDDRIRKRAHEIWEQEGRPHGKEREHWERAERDVGAGDLPPLADTAVKKRAPARPAAAKKTPAKKSPAKKA
jgi:hypothetical protein